MRISGSPAHTKPIVNFSIGAWNNSGDTEATAATLGVVLTKLRKEKSDVEHRTYPTKIQ